MNTMWLIGIYGLIIVSLPLSVWCTSSELYKEPVKVKVIPTETEVRNNKAGNGGRVGIVQYNAQIVRKDKQINLALIPLRHSIFEPGFKIQLANVDEKGNNMVVRDVTPSQNELQQIENQLFVDVKEHSIVKVKMNNNLENNATTYELEGVVGDLTILTENGEHFTIDRTGKDGSAYFDYNSELNLISSKNISARDIKETMKQTPGPLKIKPELGFVYTSDNYRILGNNPIKVTEYTAVMLHAVNLRYESIKSIKIKHSIAGIFISETAATEPYIKECYDAGGGQSCSVTGSLLIKFAQWAYPNRAKLPKHDVLVLIHNVFNEKDEWGAAFICGNCQSEFKDNQLGYLNAATAVVKDHGAFVGTHTLTHEVGHSLGAGHDGQIMQATDGMKVDATACPGTGGYIMDYTYGKLTKFKFSMCSVSSMTTCFMKPTTTCLREKLYPHIWEASAHGGEFFTMTEQCQNIYGMFASPHIYQRSLDEQCIQLQCSLLPLMPGAPRFMSEGYYPAEWSPCGVNGICSNGKCKKIANFDEQCKTALGKSNAKADPTKSPNQQCKNLYCNYCIYYPFCFNSDSKKAPLEHSPCGLNGRCINSTCNEPTPVKNLNLQCQDLLLNMMGSSIQYDPENPPENICTQLQCFMPGFGPYSSPLPPIDFSPCGTNERYCFQGKCLTIQEHLDANAK